MMEDIQLISLKSIQPENATASEMVIISSIGLSVMLVSIGIQLRLYFLMKAKKDQGISLIIKNHQVST